MVVSDRGVGLDIVETIRVLPLTKKGFAWNQKWFSYRDSGSTLLEPFYLRVYQSHCHHIDLHSIPSTPFCLGHKYTLCWGDNCGVCALPMLSGTISSIVGCRGASYCSLSSMCVCFVNEVHVCVYNYCAVTVKDMHHKNLGYSLYTMGVECLLASVSVT